MVHCKPLGFDLPLGIDAIKALGGIVVGPTGSVQLRDGRTTKCAAISINEPDFTATFDHHSRMWTALWKWSEDHIPENLHNEVSEYPVVAEIQNEYTQELHTWISNGWLVPYPEDKLEPLKGLIPLMAVLQLNKTKVCPVVDYWSSIITSTHSRPIQMSAQLNCTNGNRNVLTYLCWTSGERTSRYVSMRHCGHIRPLRLMGKDTV